MQIQFNYNGSRSAGSSLDE